MIIEEEKSCITNLFVIFKTFIKKVDHDDIWNEYDVKVLGTVMKVQQLLKTCVLK
jgi:hypothetical protein